MPFLIETKKKIGSVQNTRKITRAMQLVAANKMKKFQGLALASRAYAWSLLDTLALLSGSFDELPFAGRAGKGPSTSLGAGKRLFVVVTSDKGLCGALNQNILKTLFRSSEWAGTPESERLLITIGRKSHDAARSLGIPVVEHLQGLPEELTPGSALSAVDRILARWNSGECSEVLFASSRYVNAFTARPTLKAFLPFSPEMIADHLADRGLRDGKSRIESDDQDHPSTPRPLDPSTTLSMVIAEPSRERLLDALSRELARMLFVQAFYELKACEYSSRMVAMKSATDAAEKIIGSLTLEYNKARQSAITQQISEISGAMEASTESG